MYKRLLLKSVTLILPLLLIVGCAGINTKAIPKRPKRLAKQPTISAKQPERLNRYSFNCIESFKSDCSSSQQSYRTKFLSRWEEFGMSRATFTKKTGPIALSVLPQDQAGLVNWSLSAIRGYITPMDYISEKKEEDTGSYKLDFIVFQAKVPYMADVLFPHSLHTYWLSCNNCHPKIFKPEVGGNPMRMKDIENGEFCGKCHGKVAFPLSPDANCRRCHTLLKKPNVGMLNPPYLQSTEGSHELAFIKQLRD